MSHPAPVHVGPGSSPGYSRVVFLDPLGSHNHPVVLQGVLVEPLKMPAKPLFDQNNREKQIGEQAVPDVEAVSVVSDGARDFELVGPFASLRIVDGGFELDDGHLRLLEGAKLETVWTAEDPAGSPVA